MLAIVVLSAAKTWNRGWCILRYVSWHIVLSMLSSTQLRKFKLTKKCELHEWATRRPKFMRTRSKKESNYRVEGDNILNLWPALSGKSLTVPLPKDWAWKTMVWRYTHSCNFWPTWYNSNMCSANCISIKYGVLTMVYTSYASEMETVTGISHYIKLSEKWTNRSHPETS